VTAAIPALRAPGPPGHLLVGNLPEFARDLLGFFEGCARRYGDVVALRLGGRPACLINHPDVIESVLVTHNAQFVKHSCFWRHVDAIFGNGLLTSEGDFWLRQRRLAQPAFHRERVASYGAVMVAETEEIAIPDISSGRRSSTRAGGKTAWPSGCLASPTSPSAEGRACA
jgi:cytochrome P450